MKIVYDRKKPEYQNGDVVESIAGSKFIIVEGEDGFRLVSFYDQETEDAELEHDLWLCPKDCQVQKDLDNRILVIIGRVVL